MNTKFLIAMLAGSLILLASCTSNETDVTLSPNDEDLTVIESTQTLEVMEQEEA
jgi:hypothetical protein